MATWLLILRDLLRKVDLNFILLLFKIVVKGRNCEDQLDIFNLLLL